MARVTNPWQDTFSRSYQKIKSDLLSRIKLRLPELSDLSEGNIFIIIISMFAAVAEVLHYYIDNMSRETFFVTARRYSSLIKHSKLVDYHIKSAIPSSVDMLVRITDEAEIAQATYTIPVNTVFTSDSGLRYISTKTKTFYQGTYGVFVPVEQKELVENMDMGTIPAIDNPIIFIDETNGLYVEGSCVLRINGELWRLVETFAYSSSDDKDYLIGMSDEQRPFIEFGDGVQGIKPPANGRVIISYYVTRGENGNTGEGTINTVDTTNLNIPNINVINLNASNGGSNYEDFNMMKVHVPLSIKTLGVAITEEDYVALAQLAPGVDKAYVDYACGRYIDIYIIPDGGGIASEALRDNTYRFISSKKLITTNIQVLSTGTSFVVIELTVTGRPSVRTNTISEDVYRALVSAYDYNTSDINKVIRLSDLYSLVDNLDVVDYLTIDKLYTLPYPIEGNDTDISLNVIYFDMINVSTNVKYIIQYQDNQMIITDPNGVQFTVNIGDTVNVISEDLGVNFTIGFDNPLAGAYENGNSWEIDLLPNGGDQVINNNSIPLITRENIILHIIETV